MFSISFFIWWTFFSRALLLAGGGGGRVVACRILSTIFYTFTSIWSNLFFKTLLAAAGTINDSRCWDDWEAHYALANMIVASLKPVVRSIIFADGWSVGSSSCFCLDAQGAKAIDDDWKEEFAARVSTSRISSSSTWITNEFLSQTASRFSAVCYWRDLTASLISLTTPSICLANCLTAVLKSSRSTSVPDPISFSTNSSLQGFTHRVTVCIGWTIL